MSCFIPNGPAVSPQREPDRRSGQPAAAAARGDRAAMLQAHLPASAAEAPARRDAQAAQLRKRIARNQASQKGLIGELAQLADDTSPATTEYRKRIREHHTELYSQAVALHAQLEAITAQAASDNDPALIEQLPYAPGFLLQAPDHVREALYATLNLQCTFRGDKQQVTIRATITDTTPGIVAALIADPRTDTGSPNDHQVRLQIRTTLLSPGGTAMDFGQAWLLMPESPRLRRAG
jgi:hypothetical protein